MPDAAGLAPDRSAVHQSANTSEPTVIKSNIVYIFSFLHGFPSAFLKCKNLYAFASTCHPQSVQESGVLRYLPVACNCDSPRAQSAVPAFARPRRQNESEC